MLETFSAEGP